MILEPPTLKLAFAWCSWPVFGLIFFTRDMAVDLLISAHSCITRDMVGCDLEWQHQHHFQVQSEEVSVKDSGTSSV